MACHANCRVAKAETLFMMPNWQNITKQVQTKIFAFSCHIVCYNRVSVTINIKDSGLLVRIEDSDEENSIAWQKLRVNLEGCPVNPNKVRWMQAINNLTRVILQLC